MKKFIAALFLLLNVSWLNAQELKVRLGTHLLVDQTTTMGYGRPGTVVELDINDFFGMETQNQVFRFDGVYDFNDFHHIEFAYYSINSSGYKIIDDSFEWEDKEISAGARVSSYFNIDMLKVNYSYSFYHSEKVDMGVGLGFHITKLEAGIKAQGSVQDLADNIQQNEYENDIGFTVPLPVFGFRLSYKITKTLSTSYNYDFFRLKAGDYDGSIQNSIVTLDYSINENFGVGTGFDSYHISLKTDDGEEKMMFDRDLLGLLVYVSYQY